jgi:hypothetical protein
MFANIIYKVIVSLVHFAYKLWGGSKYISDFINLTCNSKRTHNYIESRHTCCRGLDVWQEGVKLSPVSINFEYQAKL